MTRIPLSAGWRDVLAGKDLNGRDVLLVLTADGCRVEVLHWPSGAVAGAVGLIKKAQSGLQVAGRWLGGFTEGFSLGVWDLTTGYHRSLPESFPPPWDEPADSSFRLTTVAGVPVLDYVSVVAPCLVRASAPVAADWQLLSRPELPFTVPMALPDQVVWGAAPAALHHMGGVWFGGKVFASTSVHGAGRWFGQTRTALLKALVYDAADTFVLWHLDLTAPASRWTCWSAPLVRRSDEVTFSMSHDGARLAVREADSLSVYRVPAPGVFASPLVPDRVFDLAPFGGARANRSGAPLWLSDGAVVAAVVPDAVVAFDLD